MDPPKSSSHISFVHLIILISLGTLVRIFLIPYVGYLTHYAHFTTSLNDMRSLKECFSNYQISGQTQ